MSEHAKAATIDPRTLTPGTIVQHHLGAIAILARRKEDDSGWWVEGGGGLADRAFSTDWGDPWMVLRRGQRLAGQCITHGDLAWLYHDRSVTCMHDLIVEGAAGDCQWAPMPDGWLLVAKNGSSTPGTDHA